MTKDWDAVQDEIKELSFNQKKPLEEVKELMERKYKFRASYELPQPNLAHSHTSQDKGIPHEAQGMGSNATQGPEAAFGTYSG
jgi:hypothetical protein